MNLRDHWEEHLISVIYHFYLKRKLVNLLEISQGLVMDFGCGNQHLRAFIHPPFAYIGYDIESSLSDITLYTNVSPRAVIANNSLEHLTNKELQEFFEYCSKNNSQIITNIPKFERVGKYVMSLLYGKGFRKRVGEEHKSTSREIINLMSRYYDVETRYFFPFQQILVGRKK